MYPSYEKCGQLSDRELVQKSLEQVDYFSCLYERYESQLLRYVKRMGVVTEEEAQDVLQEAFLKIWKNLNAFDPNLKLSTWLYRIVHNQAISCLRRKKSFGKDQKEEFDDKRYAEIPDSRLPGPTDDVEETDQHIYDILAQLPQKYKEILVLKFLENMSYEEISDVLKIPEGTVATRINRAKKAFRKLSEQSSVKLPL
ncbi:MAG: sigma-70 family RNA polymerase sigma factor [Phaeodactylibacter sp.]|nr:sigma-70 family RNA polymerase sigma factor [Phaeodactylibacter sp.]